MFFYNFASAIIQGIRLILQHLFFTQLILLYFVHN